MSEGLIWLRRICEFVFGLAIVGGALGLWARSKGAAVCGAAAGAFLIFFQIVEIVLDAVFRSSGIAPATLRVIFSLTFGFGTVLHYGLLIATVALATRKPAVS